MLTYLLTHCSTTYSDICADYLGIIYSYSMAEFAVKKKVATLLAQPPWFRPFT